MILAAALALSLGLPAAPAPACRPCAEGVSIIFAVIDTPQAEWQRAELAGALDAAIAVSPGRWRGAVVAYNDGGATLVAPLGSSEAAIRAALNGPRSAWSVRGHAQEAARLVEAEASKAGASPCSVVVFGAYSKSHIKVMRAELLGAAALLAGRRVIVTCPIEPGRWSCHDPEPEMAKSPRLFVVYPEAGRVAGAVFEALEDTARGSPVVECSTLTPTPTPSPAPTATRTRAPTATATRTRPPSVTPTIGHYVAYLPFADRLECKPGRAVVDVVLVLDMSTSMRRLTSAGRSKMLAAIDAAQEFITLLGPGDRAAVAGFNDTAWTEVGMTGDHQVLARALDALPARAAEGTRLDLALGEGGGLAAGARGRPVVILLTDGLPNRVPFGPGGSQEATVLAAAAATKQLARIFTVALGSAEDIDRPLMAAVASSPGDAYAVVDGETLAAIYRAIAGRIVGACP